MNPILKNIIAVVAGFVVGNVVNMGLIMLSPYLIPPPAGVDPSDIESIKANIHLYKTIHWVMPFLAHALGTLAGAFVTAKLTVNNKIYYGLGIGFLFLLGGIAVSFMIPAPRTFVIIDLIAAYIPMGILGAKLAQRSTGETMI